MHKVFRELKFEFRLSPRKRSYKQVAQQIQVVVENHIDVRHVARLLFRHKDVARLILVVEVGLDREELCRVIRWILSDLYVDADFVMTGVSEVRNGCAYSIPGFYTVPGTNLYIDGVGILPHELSETIPMKLIDRSMRTYPKAA